MRWWRVAGTGSRRIYTEGSTGPEQHHRDRELSERIQRALMSMKVEDRVVLTLRHFSELSYREIAEVLNDETRDKFDEMRYLEKSIGKTGVLAVHPLLRMSRKDLWQMYILGK